MKVLIIDNYDSFTFNLYQYVGELLEEKLNYSSSEQSESRISSRQTRTIKSFRIDVKRNDAITIQEVLKKRYDRIVLSPGPGDPKDKKYFGVCADILTIINTIPILGVCLGMQGIAYYFGGNVVKAQKPMHGKTSTISHTGKGIFAGLPQDIEVMRYHSLVADPNSLPECLEIIATVDTSLREDHLRRSTKQSSQKKTKITIFPLVDRDDDYIEIMGLKHKEFPIVGVQFHPESFATEGGKKILENFLFQNQYM